MRKIVAFILAAILVLVIGFFVLRATNQPVRQMKNATCPVTGNPVNDQHTYIYKGKEYKLCNEKCKQPLSENPEKYLCD